MVVFANFFQEIKINIHTGNIGLIAFLTVTSSATALIFSFLDVFFLPGFIACKNFGSCA